jgi:hypothetical protein
MILKRKCGEANAASEKEQRERNLQLAIEHEMLHEKYKAKCNGSGSVQQILSDYGSVFYAVSGFNNHSELV